ncbi:MAG TPA: hypothetical protein VFS67_30490 [Polyangiaceae bacterium]|nr:hypothetical protein [Polyangiaceae bacterium]
MLAWLDRGALRRSAWLPITLLLGACASVLGIQERQEDSADNYPASGYQGCRPGVSCAGCLAVHQRECELRSACAAAASSEGCAGCVCASCADSVVDCRLDSGCDAIWSCIERTRCDLSGKGGAGCSSACAAVIEAHGGVAGEAFRAAADVRTCAVTSSCLSCLAPEPEPEPSCTKANGCDACADCFHQCICTGEKFGACKTLCGSEAPPASCTPESSCTGCTTCFALCTCGGGDFDDCTGACTSDPDPPSGSCTPQESCADCADCAAQCVCEGGAAAACEQACAPPALDDRCIETSSGGDSCGGCSTSLGQCSCEGSPLEDCMAAEGALDCCGDCSGELSKCVCEQRGDADSCAEQSNHCGNAGSCSVCACRSCPGKYALCQETQGCSTVFECMRATKCQGSACRERCGDAAPEDRAPLAFDAAEALWACHQANSCACEDVPQEPVTCPGANGETECNAFRSGDLSFAACCPGAAGAGAAQAGTSSSSACGLELRRYFPGANQCEPLGQGNQHRILLETCPDRTIAEPPYNGAKLAGCCHAGDSICGVFDDVTGLGCVRSTVFGIQAEGCGGLL